jgi:uncharacterized cupin superfamily protein
MAGKPKQWARNARPMSSHGSGKQPPAKRVESQESGKWKVESGKWKVESGKWKVESGKWKVESGKWRVESRE